MPASGATAHRHRKLLIWNSIPTHHLSAFFAALRDQGFDVAVHYFDRLDERRLRLGWCRPEALPPGERYVDQALRSLEYCPDWPERIHIITGYRPAFLLRLAVHLSRRGVPWFHWSEPSRPRLEACVKYPVKRFYGMLVNRYAAGALAIGDCARRDFLRWGIREDKIRFLPYAVPPVALPDTEPADASAERAPAGPDAQPAGLDVHSAGPPGGLRFLYLGELHHRKGIDLLLEAFRRVLQSAPTARLVLVGHDRTHGRYAGLARKLGLTDTVRFEPSVPAQRIAAVLQGCDVFVLPSRFDGWGVVLNEAASAGKALISTDGCGAAHHLIEHGVNGFRVPAGDSDALADAMLEYCRNASLAARHGAASREVFSAFTPERNALRLRLVLESLLPAAG